MDISDVPEGLNNEEILLSGAVNEDDPEPFEISADLPEEFIEDIQEEAIIDGQVEDVPVENLEVLPEDLTEEFPDPELIPETSDELIDEFQDELIEDASINVQNMISNKESEENNNDYLQEFEDIYNCMMVIAENQKIIADNVNLLFSVSIGLQCMLFGGFVIYCFLNRLG